MRRRSPARLRDEKKWSSVTISRDALEYRREISSRLAQEVRHAHATIGDVPWPVPFLLEKPMPPNAAEVV